VYQGEEDKLRDFTASIPEFVVDEIARPAIRENKLVVILAEEWHTAETVCRVSDLLSDVGARDRSVLLWNANNTMGFERIDWEQLDQSATITTVSRYMKHLMWDQGVNPLVVPNGIPQRCLDQVDTTCGAELRAHLGADTMLVKVARWDPDKRWRSAMETVACLKSGGGRPVLVARGGLEAHGVEVLDYAGALGLRVRDVELSEAGGWIDAVDRAGSADVLNLTTPLNWDDLRLLYHSADGVLANSGREPFGLVGLETMAAGGAAFTGNTGEEYVSHLQNAIVLETAEADEAAWYVRYLARYPEASARMRESARQTATSFVWGRVLANLRSKVEYLAWRQGALPALSDPVPVTEVC
jgi:glycosyltransferase involved in cell wall biosynthesis